MSALRHREVPKQTMRLDVRLLIPTLAVISFAAPRAFADEVGPGVPCVVVTHVGGAVAAARGTTHVHPKARARRHHRAHVRPHSQISAGIHSSTHAASAPLRTPHPHSAPAHRAPAPATPRLDGRTPHARYRSVNGSVALADPLSISRDARATRFAMLSGETALGSDRLVDESRGPPRASPLHALAFGHSLAFPLSPHSRFAPPRTVIAPVPAAAAPRRAPRVPLSSPICSVPRAPLRPGVRRPEGTAPQNPWPSILGGLT